MIDANDTLRQLTADLLGVAVTRAQRGVGSFLTIDFGVLLEDAGRAPWHLWVYMADWRVERDAKVAFGSADTAEFIDASISQLDGLAVRAVERAAWDTAFCFDTGATLRVFTTARAGDDHWMLFRPSGDVVVWGPGASLVVDSAEARP